MSPSTTVELDKTYSAGTATYGTIQVRVVVLKPKHRDEVPAVASLDDGDPAEPVGPGSSPLSSYLERASYGRQCVVLLVNGQRHEAWDNSFITRDLGFKYLRTRTMIIVDLDGLTHEAISEIVQGSRQGLYEGEIKGAIRDRLVATLKTDPDLTRLQSEAEQLISELQTGDEVVRQKLDELIDAHHSAATRVAEGQAEPGPQSSDVPATFATPAEQTVMVLDEPDVGSAGVLPVLAMVPDVQKIRLRPGAERTVRITALPASAWSDLETFAIQVQPPIAELAATGTRLADAIQLTLQFNEPPGFDPDQYPVETSIQVVGTFTGHREVRLVEREVVVNKRLGPPPPTLPPVLLANPTKLQVVSRQPVKLTAGGPSAHVRLKWDGDDSLTAGATPPWTFRARCLSLGAFPSIGFSQPKDGRFELLLDTPHGLIADQTLEFEVEASGPAGQQLAARFTGQVMTPLAPPEPRRRGAVAPEPAAQRRPPYDLKKVTEAEWDTPTCWGETPWNKDAVAAFSEPTESSPLTLIINEDAEGLKAFREELLRRMLDETTVRERVARYTAHVYFHLYQMFRFKREQVERQAFDENVRVPTDEELGMEIDRVASTLLKMMEVTR